MLIPVLLKLTFTECKSVTKKLLILKFLHSCNNNTVKIFINFYLLYCFIEITCHLCSIRFSITVFLFSSVYISSVFHWNSIASDKLCPDIRNALLLYSLFVFNTKPIISYRPSPFRKLFSDIIWLRHVTKTYLYIVIQNG